MPNNAIDPNSINVGAKASTNQAPEAQNNVKLAKTLMSQGKAARSENDADWSTRWDYYKGKQWNDAKSQTANYRSKPVMNIIRQTIQSQLPILTDQRPGFQVLPKDPSDWQFSILLGEIIESYWDEYSMDHTLIEVLMDEMVLDAGILKCSWDPDLDDGAGNIRVECIDPNDIYIPYGCQDFTKNCPWVIHKSFKGVGELKRLFPKSADFIKADANQDDQQKSYSDDIKLVTPVDKAGPNTGTSSSESDQRQTAEVWELWMDSTEVEDIDDEEGNTMTVKKYPNGKLITILPNQSRELQCVNSPYMHGRKPFIRFVDHILPRKFWGEGETEQLMQEQRMLNRVLAHMFDVFNMASNPIWINESDSGVNSNQLTNQMAAVLTTAPGGSTKIRRDFPPALQSGIIDFYQLIASQISQTSGITEVSQGRHPPGVTAAAAIETLQEAANTRIRLKERNMQVSLQQLGYQMIGLMMQYYNEPRVARITGQGGWPKYFEFFIDDHSGEGGGYVINRKGYQFDENQGTYVADPEYTQSPETKGMMDVRILSGTAMPWQKTSRANIAFRLFDAKAIDTEELLKALEWPNADKIAERLAAQQSGPLTGQPGQGGPAHLPAAAGGG